MAGKTIDESRQARKKDRENKRGGAGSPNGKVQVTVKDSNGRAFMMMVDASAISAPETPKDQKPEFAGIVADTINPTTIEEVEYEGWLLMEDEPKANIDWDTHNRPIDDEAYSSIAPLQQNRRTPISTDSHLFYVDSGATVHISPDQSDFITLRPIALRPVKGVGGSSIAAIGQGDIKLRIGKGASITLRDALYIPNSTVRLVSVSLMARESNLISHFDDEACWLTNKSTGAVVA